MGGGKNETKPNEMTGLNWIQRKTIKEPVSYASNDSFACTNFQRSSCLVVDLVVTT